MTPQEFLPGVERLARVFNPFGWEPQINGKEYFRIFGDYDVTEWDSLVSQAIRQLTKMPNPAQLTALVKSGQRAETITSVLGDASCGQCIRGVVYVEVEKHVRKYEQSRPCDCENGQRVKANADRIAKRRKIQTIARV